MNPLDLMYQDIRVLRPMPASIVRLAALTQDSESTVEEFAEVIRYDPVLSASVLRWTNSAMWGVAIEVVEIRDAVIRLGRARILAMSVGSEIKQGMTQSFEPYGLSENELWRHSLAAGLAAEEIQTMSTKQVPNEVFTAALLHDIGKIIVHQYLDTEKCAEMARLIQEEHKTFLQAEILVLGVDHAAIGAEIARYWKFPQTLADAIGNHHKHLENPSVLYDTVYLANLVAKFVGEGLGFEAMNIETYGRPMEQLRLDGKQLEDICAQVAFRLPDIIAMYQ